MQMYVPDKLPGYSCLPLLCVILGNMYCIHGVKYSLIFYSCVRKSEPTLTVLFPR